MRATEFLMELGNAAYPYQQDKATSDVDEAYYTAGDLMVTFQRYGNEIHIEFYNNGRYDISGEGDQFRVFATVVEIMRRELPKFMDRESTLVQFSADNAEPSRVKLYQRAAPRITRLLGPGWNYTGEHVTPSMTNFEWRKMTA